ncbi:SusC/RagA family TonB-linked outer membrane protein [Sphingobacterium paucimobilis]|uniref:TonB-dependent receptor plug domain-containing protein n=1 Tax=Sphingobacterium paucimobilis HER1398 TaxID=1346330 RepID=U2HHX8_9SPHI|nr:SusC/RagA family TonB-linked outer membrane protein [Sphingobacterium paucimobilis]ERJ61366.1 hypothetical protein M472_21660 [Sphingobacterium paucimobilis HER1398]
MIKTKYRIAKVLFCLGLPALLLSHSVAEAQRLTIQIKNGSLTDLFKEIRTQTKYDFIYGNDVLRVANKINVSVKNGSIDDILKSSFEGQALTYTIDKNMVVVKLKPVAEDAPLDHSKENKQQQFSFSGRVEDKDSKQPIAGATISFRHGSNKGQVQTDANGRFTIPNLENGTVSYTVSMVGYGTQTSAVTIKGSNVSAETIQLGMANGELDQVVVTAYGQSKVRDVTGSIARVTAKDLENAPMGATVQSALQGRAAGVNVVMQSASPTSPISVVIRGASSLSGSNQPLWIIDGVPDYSNNTSGDVSNTLYNLNLNDVESIDILKDASATALYGSRAANGVVIVTTRKGVANMSPTIEFSSRFGLAKQDFNGFKYMNAEDYKKFAFAAAVEEAYNRGTFDYFTRQYLDEQAFFRLNTSEFDKSNYSPLATAFHKGSTNWVKEMTQSPWNKDYDLGLRGGTNNLVYYLSLNHGDYQGVVKGGQSKQFGGRFNMEAKLSKGLKFGMNINGSTRKTDDKDAMLEKIYRIRPDMPMYNEDGTIYTHDYYTENPLTTLANTKEGRMENFTGTGFLEWEAFRGMILRTAYTSGYVNSQNLEFNRRGTAYKNDAERKWTNQRNVTSVWENTATFARTFGKHDVLAMGGFSMESFKGNEYGMNASKFPDDDILINFGSAATRGMLKENYEWNALVSQFARAHYKYNEKYIISGTIRRDGSSRFGPGKRWGIFPSGAFAWLVHEEKFIKENFSEQLSYLKLRASIGLAGSQNLKNYDWQTRVASTTYNDSPAIVPSSLGNINLQWEQAKMTDIGLDYGIWGERIRGSIGYYQKVTDHLINQQPIPTSSAFKDIAANVGTMTNRGVEFDITADVYKKQDMKVSVDFNISTNKTYLNKINESVKDVTFSDMMYIQEGERVGQWYGYKTYGRLFVTQEEIIALQGQSETGAKSYYRNNRESMGDLYMQDLNGDGEITKEDRTIIGNADPKLFGGFGATFIYKGLRLNAQFTYAYGNKRLWDLPRNNSGNTGNYNQSYQIGGQSATFLNPYEATLPRALPYGDGENSVFSDFWLYDASYIRLNALNLAYRLPGKLFGENLLQGVDLTFQVSNLFTLTRYPGFDPQGNWSSSKVGTGMGIDNSTYPSSKTFNFGAKFTFK